jgi:signal transduction histidine kinase
VVNAAHAIADTDRVRKGGKGYIEISTRTDGRWVEIRVADTGVGIPEGIRQRIFDPFFTTKEVGKGTGQGLFVCHKVVTEKHGGVITFESEVGVGTTFAVRLPLQVPEALREAA